MAILRGNVPIWPARRIATEKLEQKKLSNGQHAMASGNNRSNLEKSLADQL